MSDVCEQPPSRQEKCSHGLQKEWDKEVFCRQCGLALISDEVRAFKCAGLKTLLDIGPKTYLQSLISGRRLARPTSFSSSYIQQRPTMIDWMLKVVVGLQLSGRVGHLAVFFVDYLMFRNPDSEAQLYVFATAAIMTAAKSVEKDERIPYIDKMVTVTANTFTNQQIRSAELTICEILDWHLQNPVLPDILEAICGFGAVFSTDHFPKNNGEGKERGPSTPTAYKEEDYVKEESPNSRHTKDEQILRELDTEERAQEVAAELRKLAYQLSELVLLDFEFYGSPVDVLAASSISFVRKIMGVTPIWPERLESWTGVTMERMTNTLRKMEEKFGESIFRYTPIIPFGNTHMVPLPESYYYAQDLLIQQEEMMLAEQQQMYYRQLLESGQLDPAALQAQLAAYYGGYVLQGAAYQGYPASEDQQIFDSQQLYMYQGMNMVAMDPALVDYQGGINMTENISEDTNALANNKNALNIDNGLLFAATETTEQKFSETAPGRSILGATSKEQTNQEVTLNLEEGENMPFPAWIRETTLN
eukprot:TRINITY_DN3758_c0_g3_i3.p1 TRINITY_DN3758_c0_g3~~TRINITY_DN3758_c0_g3_i3.p1  ORF type:complete len:532 (+),score=83.69 TRINITY_DN3758_c0_g3_i3:118-1713(+)